MPLEPGFRHAGPLALVGLGGAVGTSCRSALLAAHPPAPGQIPWVTLGVNLAGALLLGGLLGGTSGELPPDRRTLLLRWCLGTGLLGGFTTYSTFMTEALGLVQHGRAGTAATYVVLSILAGAVAAAVGWYAAAHGRRPPPQAGTDPE